MSLSDEDRLSLLARIADLEAQCDLLRKWGGDLIIERVLNPPIFPESLAPPLYKWPCPRCGFGGPQLPMDFTQGDPS